MNKKYMETPSSDFVYMDFEFGHTRRRYLSLVCASVVCGPEKLRFDLRKRKEREELTWHLRNTWMSATLVAYNITAEVRSCFSVLRSSDLKDLPFRHYICLQREHRMLANRSKDILYGKVISPGGKAIHRPYVAAKDETKKDSSFINLTNAIYKFLGIYDPCLLYTSPSPRD